MTESAEDYIKRKLESGDLTHRDIEGYVRFFQQENPIGDLEVDGKPGPNTQKFMKALDMCGSKDDCPDTEPGAVALESDPKLWLHGVDTSRYQDSNASKYVNWAKVVTHANPRIYYAIVKATEGQTYTDPEFSWSWQELGELADRSLVIRGAYHFLQPDAGDGDPEKEARHACEVIGELTPGTLPIVGDLEDRVGLPPKNELVPWMLAWCKEVRRISGRDPIVYTYTSYWAEELQRTNELNRFILWQAHYTNSLSRLPTQLGKWDWLFWQWTVEKSSTIDGIKGGLDRNVFRGGLAALRSLARIT